MYDVRNERRLTAWLTQQQIVSLVALKASQATSGHANLAPFFPEMLNETNCLR